MRNSVVPVNYRGSVICSKISYAQIQHHVAISQLTCNEVAFLVSTKCKTLEEVSDQIPVIKVIKGDLKYYSKDPQTPSKRQLKY